MSDSIKGKLGTILVVDDDENVRTLVVAILERAHFKANTADSGPNAVRLWAKTEGSLAIQRDCRYLPEFSRS